MWGCTLGGLACLISKGWSNLLQHCARVTHLCYQAEQQMLMSANYSWLGDFMAVTPEMSQQLPRTLLSWEFSHFSPFWHQLPEMLCWSKEKWYLRS